MWALRRASARIQGLRLGGMCVRLESSGYCLENKLCNAKHSDSTLNRLMRSKRAYSNLKVPCQFSPEARSFASQVGTESGREEEDNSEDGLSDIGMREITTTAKGDSLDSDSHESISEAELSDDYNDDMGVAPEYESFLDTRIDTGEELSQQRSPRDLFTAILKNPTESIYSILDKYEAEGKELSRPEIKFAILGLRMRHMYVKALQISEWLERKKHLDIKEQDYASILDLIAKLRGTHKAEEYIKKIPKAFVGEKVYQALLENCVYARDVKKAEEVFDKIKAQDFSPTMISFACNQLLLLYQKVDLKKISGILQLMEEENVKPTSLTYRILIEAKGKTNDYDGMDQLVESMKAEGIEPDMNTKAVVARYYAIRGMKDSAVALLKEMEGSNLAERRSICHLLIPVYAELGLPDHVERVWKVCESRPRMVDTVAVVRAWGRLKEIEKAEAVFENLIKRDYKLRSWHYSQLLRSYVDNKMLDKGKALVSRMGDEGIRIGPMTWDALIKLYVEAGEVEKADSLLHKGIKQNDRKMITPMFSSYLTLLDEYARRGDVHNAEKIFYGMRQAGYKCRLRPFEALVLAYQNAKLPAYGMRDRLKADNLFPNREFTSKLARVDAFRKTYASELLD